MQTGYVILNRVNRNFLCGVFIMLLINLLGVLLIIAIIYWFWWYEPNKVNSDSNQITITVSNGVYSPAYIKVLLAG